MEDQNGDNQTPQMSPLEEEEPDPVPFFRALGQAVDLERCWQAYRISDGDPSCFLDVLQAFTRAKPDALPSDIVRELPVVRAKLGPRSRPLQRRIKRELRFLHQAAMGVNVGRKVASDLAPIEVQLDLAQLETATGVRQDMSQATTDSAARKRARNRIRGAATRWNSAQWRRARHGNPKAYGLVISDKRSEWVERQRRKAALRRRRG